MIAATTRTEQDLAFEELKSALTALIFEVENISKHNLLHFPAAIERRKVH